MNEKWKSKFGMSRGSGRKVANGLVAASSAAVLAVYAAGYSRTQEAADGLEAKSERRPAGASRAGIPHPVEGAAAVPVRAAAEVSEAKVAEDVAAPMATVTDRPAVEAKTPEAAAVAPTAAPVNQVAAAPVVEAKLEKPEMPAVVAPAPVAAPAPAASATPSAKYKDGTYTGWGTCRHGDIQAQVVIEGGRIMAATIIDCRTRYSCDVISPLPPQVARRQSGEVDYVSGATQSADAFYFAVKEALDKAK